jgi:putative membrane protein
MLKNSESLDLPTRLAIDRTRVAYDGTAQSLIRTGTSMITFGFSVYKFFQIEPRVSGRMIGPHEFAVIMVGAGLASLIAGACEHQLNLRALRAIYPTMRRSATSLITVLLSVLGVLVLLAVIFRQ